MNDCLFCKIIERKTPSHIVYEDEQVLAFTDLNPQAPVHILIVPKKHIETLNDVQDADNPLLGHMLSTAKKIAAEMQIEDSGYRTVINCNEGGGQMVYHIHLHLLGGRTMDWPPG